ncbi:MAG: peptidoglycan DD-metalloendopeptidase family protein [Bacteroidales bacterium]
MEKLILFLTLFFALSCSQRAGQNEANDKNNLPESQFSEFGIPALDFDIKEGRIESGHFFSNLMEDLGASNADIYSLTQESKGIFDLKKLRVGNNYRAFYTKDENSKLAYLIYKDSKTTTVVFGLHDSIFVKAYNKKGATRTRVGEATITESLYYDVERAGLSVKLAARLADIYAWSIDFFGLQKGDSFKVLYDEIQYEGDEPEIGEVYAAFFVHQGKVYDAYRYYDQRDTGSVQYFNAKGENLKKAFLKAPLSFTRVSSGFTYARKHPITRIVRPHTGVDYAAPKGTPVMSIGDGTVISKGWAGGGGNTIKIKHNATYTTGYMHLSAFAKGLKKGSHVHQGQVIGNVGSTGMSTGPHLDFRVWKNNTPINPLKMESPPAKEIGKSQMEAFRNQIKVVKFQTDSVMSVQYLDTLLLKLGKR